ncbi:hypothetical protein ECANGB1_2725 [Enterospora canceri]|uniref:Uncharacterized protein n=1 Tax=Enterospora canceri TaxID=1081671 RepID=A0A1Y1S4U4_9MICR|nr:hypothetical protein ECANGB1_2725 [Enterospora canceri]
MLWCRCINMLVVRLAAHGPKNPKCAFICINEILEILICQIRMACMINHTQLQILF